MYVPVGGFGGCNHYWGCRAVGLGSAFRHAHVLRLRSREDTVSRVLSWLIVSEKKEKKKRRPYITLAEVGPLLFDRVISYDICYCLAA